jgi:hypothetical protein
MMPGRSSLRVVVYTANIGGYDPRMPSIERVDSQLRYVFVTDDPWRFAEGESPWEVVATESLFDDEKLTSGFIKTHPGLFVPDADVAVWIDGNFENVSLTADVCRDAVRVHPAAAIEHLLRSTVAAEAAEVSRQGLDDPIRVEALLDRLRSAGFVDDWGLAATMLVIRDLRVGPVHRFNERWWSWIVDGSRRDQLSFTPALWAVGFAWERLAIEWWHPNEFFSRNRDHRDAPGRFIASTSAERGVEPLSSP